MRKLARLAALSLAVVLVTASAIAIAARPKPNSIYSDSKKNVELQTDDKGNIDSFNAGCPPGQHFKYRVSVVKTIHVSKKGKFDFDGQNAVNTPDGGTLAHTSRVTIKGKFVSKKKAKGKYKIYKDHCKKT